MKLVLIEDIYLNLEHVAAVVEIRQSLGGGFRVHLVGGQHVDVAGQEREDALILALKLHRTE